MSLSDIMKNKKTFGTQTKEYEFLKEGLNVIKDEDVLDVEEKEIEFTERKRKVALYYLKSKDKPLLIPASVHMTIQKAYDYLAKVEFFLIEKVIIGKYPRYYVIAVATNDAVKEAQKEIFLRE